MITVAKASNLVATVRWSGTNVREHLIRGLLQQLDSLGCEVALIESASQVGHFSTPNPVPQPSRALTVQQERVREAFRELGGISSWEDARQAAGIAKSSMNHTVGKLVEMGVVAKCSDGRYRLADTPEPVAAQEEVVGACDEVRAPRHRFTTNQQKVLDTLCLMNGTARWVRVLRATGLAKSSLNRAVNSLLAKGVIGRKLDGTLFIVTEPMREPLDAQASSPSVQSFVIGNRTRGRYTPPPTSRAVLPGSHPQNLFLSSNTRSHEVQRTGTSSMRTLGDYRGNQENLDSESQTLRLGSTRGVGSSRNQFAVPARNEHLGDRARFRTAPLVPPHAEPDEAYWSSLLRCCATMGSAGGDL